ncbi:hypothetical protein Q75_14800 [Bacillus coahuilensis p1.1.43]|uniref:DEAD/DEAH box helicase n=1 Tax=Bacillus coahuilensis p1.1.43 TaxID=1150625 RepID=A0A147K563_9BACI|nr:DEAD/DEAH box helicase [Bacillus coahuilensis]KUP04713.1 hypothetical protein Q75_14800 [Bacillus coahuilensis p1.1.43]
MFDNYSYTLFNNLPSLPEFNIDESRRLLSRAYIYSIKMQLGLAQEEFKSIDIEDLSEEELDKIEDEINSEPLTLYNELYHELRRLGDTLESSAIFDNNEDERTVKSASFIAAESLSLLSTLLNRGETNKPEETMLSNELIYTRIEAAMMFLIAGYDANAQTEIREVIENLRTSKYEGEVNNLHLTEEWLLKNLFALLTNQLWNINRNKPLFKKNTSTKSLRNLIIENKIEMFSLIGESIIFYIDWLTGDDINGLKNSLEILTRINKSSYKNKNALYPEVYHISKVIMVMMKETSKRSLFHNTPLPINQGSEFISYISGRVKGNSELSSRPFIWESAKEFIYSCLPGPNKHTIVNQPTGSGKSFIAELAVAHSLSNGWVLYLAPTNALVHQIKRDLKKSLQFYGSVDISTFVGGDEYTRLEDEFLDKIENTNKFVAVMTPEKCAMSLRINPEVFQNCSLCVFDECHLLGDGARGATVDLVLGSIMSINNNIKFVLMSAMVNNPKDLSDWLKESTTNDTKICSILWKPTRSIRGAIGVEYESFKKTSMEAKVNLDRMPDKRKNEIFEPTISILYSLSGIWKKNHADYSIMETNLKATYTLSRRKSKDDDEWIYGITPKSWVNVTSRTLGIELAEKGMPTIVFIPSNRHYPFTLARGINHFQSDTITEDIEQKLLLLAERELGVDSEVKFLLSKSVGVHTSYMLETEKEAVERAFSNQRFNLLFATGTLAQGLNLPSVAVVIAGTRVGDAREANTPEAKQRSKSLILNAIGRAGRAGFSNQSLSLIVPNSPLHFKHEKEDIDKSISELDVLSDEDASIKVKSPLGQFLENILNGSIQADRASVDELTIMSMLTSDNEQEEVEKTKQIIGKTYAAAYIKHKVDDETLSDVTNKIINIKNEFLEKAAAPEWSVRVARKAGFDFFTTNSFVKIVSENLYSYEIEVVLDWSIEDWKNFLFMCMKDLPPYYIQRLLNNNVTQKPTFINDLTRLAGDRLERNFSWDKPADWYNCWHEFSNIIWMFMEGGSYADIAKAYLHIDGEIDPNRSAGKPIPDTLALVKKQIDYISSYAGLLVAALEEILFKDKPIPFNLNALPLAIKNGLKDHSTFYWYNYGYRNRLVAHKLALILPLEDFHNEQESISNVLRLKRIWLRNELDLSNITPEEREILEAASMVIKNL